MWVLIPFNSNCSSSSKTSLAACVYLARCHANVKDTVNVNVMCHASRHMRCEQRVVCRVTCVMCVVQHLHSHSHPATPSHPPSSPPLHPRYTTHPPHKSPAQDPPQPQIQRGFVAHLQMTQQTGKKPTWVNVNQVLAVVSTCPKLVRVPEQRRGKQTGALMWCDLCSPCVSVNSCFVSNLSDVPLSHHAAT